MQTSRMVATESVPALLPQPGTWPIPVRGLDMDDVTRERFWAKVDKNAPNGCWEWTAYRWPNGYGAVRIGGILRRGHRVSYELLVGPVPDGLVLDHLCRNRGCVNPAHLQAVTFRENVLRGVSGSAVNARKTHCPKSHSYEIDGWTDNQGKRRCRVCSKARAALLINGRRVR